MGFLQRLNIGQKIIGLSVAALLAVVLVAYEGLGGLSSVQSQAQGVATEAAPVALQSLRVSTELQSTVASLGFHLLSGEAADAQAFQAGLSSTRSLIEQLHQMQAVVSDEENQSLLQQVEQGLDQLQGMAPDLLKLTQSQAANMPAIAYANEHNNPMYREKLALLSALLETELAYEPETPEVEPIEASPAASAGGWFDGVQSGNSPSVATKNPDAGAALMLKDVEARKSLLSEMVALRYRWVTLNNEIRLYLASRAPQAIENIATYRQAITTSVEAIEKWRDSFGFEQEEAFDGFIDGLDQYWAGLEQLIAIHGADGWRQDSYLIRTEVSPLVAQVNSALQALKDRQQQQMQAATAHIDEIYSNSRNTMLGVVTLILVLLGVGSVLLVRAITRPLQQAVNVADKIALGDLDNQVAAQGADETAALLRSLDTMQTDLRERIEADAVVAAQNLRIRQALDSVSAAVTVSGEDNQLIYLNTAACQLFENIGFGRNSEQSDYDARSLIGGSLAAHIEEADLQAVMKARLEAPRTIDGRIAGRCMQLEASPVYDQQGHYQGRVTQWRDRSDELKAAEQERQRIAEERDKAAVNQRIRVGLDSARSCMMMTDNAHQIVYFNQAAAALFPEQAQQLLGSSVASLFPDPQQLLEQISSLDEPLDKQFLINERTLRTQISPVFDEQGERLGTAIEWVDRTLEVATEEEIDRVVEAAVNGDLSQRLSEAGKRGFFQQLTFGVNSLLDKLEHVFEDISHSLEGLAEGNLEARIERAYKGAFGQASGNMNRSLDNLHRIVGEIGEISLSVGNTAEEINAGNTNLSVRTERQAASLQQTASSVEEITSTVANTASNAQRANGVATDARNKAEQGGIVVGEAVEAMDRINQASNRIAEIIGVIDEIAFQTNLLALNASVEAARAGEQGRGFAVVATEVRNLASRSAEAAKEIKELINDSVDKVQAGSELVNQSGETLTTIVDSVREMGDLIAEIAAASSQQQAGIAQVNQAVTAMDELTQQNAALAEQTSAASQDMSSQARQMRERMAFFQIEQSSAYSAPDDFEADFEAEPTESQVQSVKPVTLDDDEWDEF